jgi:Uma2 family endonuclease
VAHVTRNQGCQPQIAQARPAGSRKPRICGRNKSAAVERRGAKTPGEGLWEDELQGFVMSVRTGLITFAEFEKLPDPPVGHYELHHGELAHMPPRKKLHMKIQQTLFGLLLPLVEGRGFLTIEFGFRPTPEHEAWQTDLGFVLQKRWEQDSNEYFMGAPDLVMEVLLPSNTMDEINDKTVLCMANGCTSFWVVDPKRKRVSVTEGNITKHYTESEAVSCPLWAGEIRVRDIFSD